MKKLTIILPLILCLILFSISKTNAQMVTTIAGPNININDAIAIDDEGNIYGSKFSTTNNGAIYKISPDGTVSLFSDGYYSCNGMDFDSQGNLYVVDYTATAATHQIYKVNMQGEKTAYGPPISGASGILFDPLSDTLYVSQYTGNNNSIVKLAPDETVVPFCDDEILDGPVGMAFDDNHEFYTANFGNGEIFKITHGGDSVKLLATVPHTTFWGIGFLTYASGYLYATGIGKHKIYKVSLSGEIFEFAGSGTAGLKDGQADTAQFNRPNGITTNAAQDTIYISDYGSKSVRMITDLTTSIEYKPLPQKRADFELLQNFPNPLNNTTTITYELFKDADISLTIYTLTGKKQTSILYSHQQIGEHSINVDASSWPSGIYFYKLESNGISMVKKMNVK